MTGREEQLRQGAARLEEIERGPRSILVTGPAGIGKSTVVQALAEHAVGHGFRLLEARATQAESKLAFVGLTDLLAHVPDSLLERLPAPQRSALFAALLREHAGDGRHDRRAVAAGTLSLLRALAAQGPVLVVVDDLQWVDVPTARILEYVARRLTVEPVALLASRRTDEAAGADQSRLLPDVRTGSSAVLELAPLDDASIDRLVTTVAAEAGRPLTMRQRRRITGLASGNPLFARELARSHVATDAVRLPATILQLVEDHISALPGATRELLLLAATLRNPTVGLVASASGMSAETVQLSLEGAAEAGVLDPLEDSPGIAFSHPLYRAGMHATATPAARRAAHRSAASVVVDPEEAAGHLALAATTPDPDLAARLDDAAGRALARGAPEAAIGLARDALRLTPHDHRDDTYAREVTIAELEFHAGEIASSRASLEELVRRPAPPPQRARALKALGELESHQDTHVDAIRRFSEALELDPAPASQGHLRAHLAYSTVSDGDFDGARRHALAGLALAEAIPSRSLRAVIYAVAAITGYLVGEPLDEDLARRALAGEDLNEPLTMGLRPSLIVGHLRMYTGQLTDAIAILANARNTVVAGGHESDLVVASSSLAWAQCWAGDLAGAQVHADEALAAADRLDSVPGRCIASAYGAVPHAFAGELDRAQTLATEALQLAETSGFGTGRMWASWALIVSALGADRLAQVVPVVDALLAVVDRQGLPTPVRVMALADALEVLIRLGDLDRAARYHAVLQESGSRTGTTWAQMQAHRCAALMAAATGDLDRAWLEISEALRFSGKHELALETARTRLVAGQIARRRRQRREARMHIEQALAAFDLSGAGTWAALARAELERTSPHRTDPLHLTPTEARVARLAADGLTNRAVAAQLGISPKTVEANLARIYRKLGIHSRAELGATLGAGH